MDTVAPLEPQKADETTLLRPKAVSSSDALELGTQPDAPPLAPVRPDGGTFSESQSTLS